MYSLSAVTLLIAMAYVQAGGIGLAGSVDGGAIISGPSGVVSRLGLGAVGPIVGPGAIIAGGGLASGLVAPGAILAGPGGLGLGIGINGLGINAPGLAARALGLEGSGIEGQWIPDINEKLYDDGSYKPSIYGH